MIYLLRKLLKIAWLGVLISPANAQELPSADDYAYVFPLAITDNTGFFELDVPIDFYRPG